MFARLSASADLRYFMAQNYYLIQTQKIMINQKKEKNKQLTESTWENREEQVLPQKESPLFQFSAPAQACNITSFKGYQQRPLNTA